MTSEIALKKHGLFPIIFVTVSLLLGVAFPILTLHLGEDIEYAVQGTPVTTVTGENDDDTFGWNVSCAGDVNGDGFDDIIVGAPGCNGSRGSAYLFFGGPWFSGDLLVQDANVTLSGDAAGNLFGWDVSGAGDMDDDGFDDVIVGAPGADAVYIFFGNDSIKSSDFTPTTILNETFESGSFATNGWTTQDGSLNDGGGPYQTPYIHQNGSNANNPASTVGAVLRGGDDTDDQNGVGTTSSEDPYISITLDISSYGTVIVTYNRAAQDTVNNHNTGEDLRAEWTVDNWTSINELENTFIVGNLEDTAMPSNPIWGQRTFMLPEAALHGNFTLRFSHDGSWENEYGYVDDVLIEGTAGKIIRLDGYSGSLFGSSVSGAGDVNNDGYDDVLVGAPGHENDAGAAFTFFGDTHMDSLPNATYANVTLYGDFSGDRFAFSVSAAGDVNNDGSDDVLVGAPGANKVYVFLNYVQNNPVELRFVDDFEDGILADWYEEEGANGAASVGNVGGAINGSYHLTSTDDTDVVSPIINAGAYYNLTLTYKRRMREGDWSGNEDMLVMIRVDGGAWVSIPSEEAHGDTQPVNVSEYREVNLSQFGTNNSRIEIKFDLDDGGFFDTPQEWDFDDVQINGTPYFTRVELDGENPDDRFGFAVSNAGDIDSNGHDDIIIGAPYADYWWSDSWSYRQKLTFNNSGQSEALVNFPVLVNLTSPYFNYSRAKPNGTDLRFIDSDGATELKYHIEEWNPSGCSYIWVNATEIEAGSSSDHIWMYYGNPIAPDAQDSAGTYDHLSAGVWHLAEDPGPGGAGDIKDSTSNYNNGTAQGSMSSGDLIPGRIGYGIDFDGNNDYIDCGTGASLDISSAITVEAWAKTDTDNRGTIASKHGSGDYGWVLHRVSTTDSFGVIWSIDGSGFVNPETAPNTFETDTWYHLVITYNGSIIRAYINGVEDTGGDFPYSYGGLHVSATSTQIARDGYMGSDSIYLFSGILDEVCISNTARSADWIKARYLSMDNRFVVYGSEETKTSHLGKAYVFDGSYITGEGVGDRYIELSGGDIANVTFTGESSNNLFGYSVSSAGNLTDDGFSGLIVGAPNANGNGAIYAFYGRASMAFSIPAVNADYIEIGEYANDRFGWSVSGAGDVILAEGYDEIIVGAPFHDPIIDNNAGKAYILRAISRPLIKDISAVPDILNTGENVNITCNVTAIEGVASVWVNISLPGGGYINDTMMQGPGDQWYYNYTCTSVGTYQYKIWANDTTGNGTESGIFLFEVVNRLPTLLSGQVSPVAGYADTWFNFTVMYIDLDDHVPGFITVNITGIGIYDLVEVDPLDIDHTDGKEYYYNTTGFSQGQYTYHFAACDAVGDWIETISSQLEVVNRCPALSSGQATPATGYIDTDFNFTVDYIDLDNHAPDTITVNITGLGVYSLIEVDPLDIDYTSGKEYYYSTSGFNLGQYTYHFAACDTVGDWNESNTFQLEVIDRLPALISGQVNPSNGVIDTMFNFTVTFIDLDDQAPDVVTLNVTGVGVFELIEVDPLDVDYSDDKEYYYHTSGFTIGQYTFHFAANETGGQWVESGILGFEVLNRIPTLSQGQVSPAIGFDDTWFNFTVTYTDLDGHAPDNITVNITNLGIYPLNEADPIDMDFTDGKSHYLNISGLPPGTAYIFHFAANDTLGSWASETPEIDAPDVLQRSATLTALDETVEYSDDALLAAILMESGTPIAGEDVAFYIDMNHNGMYEPGELVGSGTTLADGSISVTYSAYLVPDTYNYTAVYTGSGGFIVEDGEASLTVDPEQASLTARNYVVEEGEVVALNATLKDFDGQLVAGEQVDFIIDRNRNGIYEGSEFIGSGTTSGSGIASFDYTVNLLPENYGLWARYEGSGNYTVIEIEGQLTVQNAGNNPPNILGTVPDQVKLEDSLPWTLDLTSFEGDVEDSGPDLKWYLTGIDTTLYSVTGMNSTDDVFTFIPVENAFGNDEVILWLADSSGDWDSQVLWINITPVNDLPYFDPMPPNLFVHYDDPGTDEDDPTPWDYTFYVHDIETPKESLVILTSEPTVDSGDGYAEVDGLNATFHYPQSMVGRSVMVTLTLYDGSNATQTIILVNITSDWVPELVSTLPDVTIRENTTLYNVFDLDDYFTDRDHDSLFFSSGYSHLIVEINSHNTVDITAMGQWTGTELVTFRAKDPTGAIVEDTITVTVISVNDGPVISGAPDLNVHFDYSYGFDFSPYISDPDNSSSELTLWTSASTDNIWLQQHNNLGVVVNYPESANGMTFPVTIFVSDGIETASQEIQITVSDNFPPELLYKLPDITFDEDTVLEDAILLSYYFLDIDGDALYFTNGSNCINVTINDDLTVDFAAPLNWHGFERVTFRATDPTTAIAEDTILVVVVPVNDPPVIENIPSQEKNEGDQWVLDLSQYISDVDNNASELIITVESEVGEGYVVLTGSILVFQYPEGIHDDIVTITVSDGEAETQRSFSVILKSSTPVAPSVWDMLPWPWILLACFGAVGGAFAFYRKKSRYQVHEAFLIHEKGLPIAHASQEESSELEDVVVSGMFTAVQDFINDAFTGSTPDDQWELEEMKFGDNKILIERSDWLYLATIFEGNGSKLAIRVRKILKKINEQYGNVFADWDGDMAQLTGISAMIAPLIIKRMQKHVEPASAEDQGDELEDQLTEKEDTAGAYGEEQDTLSEGGEETLPEEGGVQEIEVYECPECESEIRGKDIRCPICGVEFTEMEELRSASSGTENDNEMIEPMNEDKSSED
ncbi:MAG: DUF2341 domain-containing protein [Thermoplasmata archaeon]|nr:MAG: DUF2341 domain-containing protein [Thermoplasmata archaeon]